MLIFHSIICGNLEFKLASPSIAHENTKKKILYDVFVVNSLSLCILFMFMWCLNARARTREV